MMDTTSIFYIRLYIRNKNSLGIVQGCQIYIGKTYQKGGSRCDSAVKWRKWENKLNWEAPGLLPTPGNLLDQNVK
jgi:hypothetical protein